MKKTVFIVDDDLDCICHRNLHYGDIHFDHVDYENDDDVSYGIHGVNRIDFDDVF
jgi:hypothetical protein